MHQPPTFTVDGVAIREERMQAGLEISDLAAAAGISRRYLSHLENGTRNRMRPRRYTALRAALKSTDERLLAPQRTDTPKERPDG
ncbi:helix-turn-helix domain-containing protein [Streptomyces lavendulocolor]|uniref:helix-turn-helix domain-containing protein n=1 Tax=Streptomyces lavendulocolor TaxID=67316 RepID=UPI003C2B93AC